MAKRYYQNSKDRRNESKGMKDYYMKDYYSGLEGRKRMEAEGSGMIREDNSEIANLPKEVMFKEYPKTDYFRYDLNDDQKGVNVQMDDDVRKETTKVGKKYPEKY